MGKRSLRYPEELLEKAEQLISAGRIRRVSPTLCLVRGDHSAPTYPEGYWVEKLTSGVWACTCDGFKKRRVGFCSHVAAVMILESQEKGEADA